MKILNNLEVNGKLTLSSTIDGISKSEDFAILIGTGDDLQAVALSPNVALITGYEDDGTPLVSGYLNGYIESHSRRLVETDAKISNLVNTLNTENLPVAVPILNITWIAFNTAGSVLSSIPNEGGSGNNLVLEKGYSIGMHSVNFIWQETDGYQNPTSVDAENSKYVTTVLPDSATVSETTEYLDATIFDNDEVIVTLQAEEKGYKVDDRGYLVPVSGYVKSSAKATVTFRDRLYYGITTEDTITENVLRSLSFKSLVATNKQTLQNITTSTTQHFVYASTTKITSIIQDGATPVLGAFTETVIEFYNNAGKAVTYYVYRTNNKGAFTNANLKFS